MQILERIIHVWSHYPQMQETVQPCIDSMPRRIEALIAAKEYRTLHEGHSGASSSSNKMPVHKARIINSKATLRIGIIDHVPTTGFRV
ncbi:hypothetical protein TNCV_3951371 [Trichonephila clavipes]|nr:hypothetical protein TNCV_3951371 [Trichonephila clavipes]